MDKENCKEWFASWFDSPYYHLLYKDRDTREAEEFIDNLFKFLDPSPDSKILDLACGKGRHAIYMNKKGFDVTGIDLSPQSINYALQFENEKLNFYVQDMRQPCRINYFDYVFNLFTSFGYFENERDNYAVVNAAAKSLKKGGLLVIDFMNVKKVTSCLISSDVKNVEGVSFTIKKSIQDRFIIKKISFEDKGKQYFYEEKVKLLELSDFEKYLTANHLKMLHLCGDYELNLFDENTSERLIIIAQKD